MIQPGLGWYVNNDDEDARPNRQKGFRLPSSSPDNSGRISILHLTNAALPSSLHVAAAVVNALILEAERT